MWSAFDQKSLTFLRTFVPRYLCAIQKVSSAHGSVALARRKLLRCHSAPSGSRRTDWRPLEKKETNGNGLGDQTERVFAWNKRKSIQTNINTNFNRNLFEAGWIMPPAMTAKLKLTLPEKSGMLSGLDVLSADEKLCRDNQSVVQCAAKDPWGSFHPFHTPFMSYYCLNSNQHSHWNCCSNNTPYAWRRAERYANLYGPCRWSPQNWKIAQWDCKAKMFVQSFSEHSNG